MEVGRSNGTQGAYSAGVTQDGKITAMSPESLVALCAMQLQQFDETILSRMNEKDKNMSLQEKLAGLTAKLGRFTEGVGAGDYNAKREILAEMDSLIKELESDPSKKELTDKLKSKRDKLLGSKTGDPTATGSDFQAKYAKAGEEIAKIRPEIAHEDFDKKYGKYIDFENGCVNAGDTAAMNELAGMSQAERDAVMARIEECKAWKADGAAQVGSGSLTASELDELKATVDSAGKGLSSRNDAILMELQSLVSQRSTSIQMTSNLTNTLLESAKTIAGNIGR